MTAPQNAFTDSDAVARYAEGPVRNVPGFVDMQRMARLLLEESVPRDGRVLVLGAGGGLELKTFASVHPEWTFVGVDPSAEMLTLAQKTLGPLSSQVELIEGYIDRAPGIAFDGATCLLTFHFLSVEERLRTLQQIHKRLKTGAPFILAHLSFPQQDQQREKWLSRYAAFIASSGIAVEKAKAAASAVSQRLTICSPEQEEALLQDAGFSNVDLFYVGFAFRGWISYA